MDLDTNRIPWQTIGPGMLGAVAGLRFAPGASWRERAVNLVSAFACAVYVGPAAAEYLSLTGTRSEAGIVFAVGMFGMALAMTVVGTLRAVDWSGIASGWLRRKE